jgi:ethanolamine utilization microcompartment shell protein EutS
VPLHKSGNVELGLLDNLHLADIALLDGEDGRALTLDLLSGGSGNKSLNESLKVSLSGQGGHGVDHLGADGADLGRLGVTGLLELILLLLGEGDAEHADDVTIGGTSINIGLNDRLLLLDEGAKLITGHVHAVEVEETVVSLNILDTELDLAVSHGLVVVEVGKGELDNTSLQSIGSNLGTLGLGDDGLSAVLLGKDGGGDELVPLLLGEGVDNLLLASLLGLSESLVLSLLMAKSKERGVRCDSCTTYGGATGCVSSEQAGGPVVQPREEGPPYTS